MIKAILIDDEPDAVIALDLALREYCPDVEVTGKALSAQEGIELIRSKNPDLVFLDIQMPHISGIELLESFGEERNFHVVFVTAFDQFAIRAFRLSATDYLLKPININELKLAVKKIREKTGQKENLRLRAKNIRAALSGKIIIPVMHGYEFIEVDDIVRIQADGSYSVIYFLEKKPQVVSKNLKEFQYALEAGSFLRIHKSHLVNLKYIVECTLVKNGGFLKMRDGSQVEISRTHKASLAATFGPQSGYLK